MVITDNYGFYAVKLDYSHTTAEIIRIDGEHEETSIVFMQGEEAENFVRDYERVPDNFMNAFLSDYDCEG